MNNKGQFSIVAALLVAVVLVGTVITTYATLRQSTSQEQPQVLTAIDETNLALDKVLGFTVGYYGSVLQVTGDSAYAKNLTKTYLRDSLGSLSGIKPEWGAVFTLVSLNLSANWFTNASYSAGEAVVNYSLPGLGISGMSYTTSCRLDVQVSNSSIINQACLTVLKDGSEPVINLGRGGFKFYRYLQPNASWGFEEPSGEFTAFANGTYLIGIPQGMGIDASDYMVQVTDTRGIMVAAASFSRITASFMWNTTSALPAADYVDGNSTLLGSQSNFTAQQYGPDSIYDRLTEGASAPVLPDYYPSSYVLGNSTALVSGELSYVQFNDGVRMIFRSYASAFSAQTLYAHQETTSISGTPYYLLKTNPADSSGVTLSAALSSSRVLLGKSVYNLQGVPSIPASTWTLYYRAWRDAATSGTPTNSSSSTVGGWTNPANAYADNGGYAYSTMNGTKQTYNGYGFLIPSNASITQVRVRLDAYCSGGDGNDVILVEVSDDSNWLAAKQQQSLAMSEATYWINVTGWTSWTPTKVNGIKTRVTQIRAGSLTDEVRLDWIPIEVTYTIPITVTSSPGSNSGTGGGWSNPSYAYADDSSYAVSNADNEQVSYWGYNFTMPSDAVITQVRIRLDAWLYNGGDDDIEPQVSVDGGINWLPASPPQQSLTSSQQTYWIDATSWASWTPSVVNNTRTRVTHDQDGQYDEDIRLDWIPVEVTYTVTPTVVTQSPSSTSAGWTNPTNAYADGGSYAYSTVAENQQVYGGYGFAIPADAQITQVRVRLDAWRNSGGNDDLRLEVSADGGGSWLANTYLYDLPSLDQNNHWVDVTSWASWTPTIINSDGIKVRVTHVAVSTVDEVLLDWIPIQVSYTVPIIANVDVDVLIRMSDGSIRTVIATSAASSGVLQSTATTLSGTYSWNAYTVVDQTDYLEIDYYVNVTTIIPSKNAYLQIDNQSLASGDHTRIANIILPSEYTSEVEFTGTSNMASWAQLVWATDSSCTVAGVNVTVQLYNYTAGAYVTSGNGFNSTVIGTSDVTATQTITANPESFRSGSGEWKLKFKAVKSNSPQFDLNIDLVRYSPVPNYMLNIEEQWTNVAYSYPRQDLCIKAGELGSETLVIDVWHGGTWVLNVAELTGLVDGWKNVSITQYIESSTFKIRFRDSNNSSDPTQTSWDIDAVLLNPQPDIDTLLKSIDHVITVELLQNGTMRWLGQNLQLETEGKPIPPVPVKAIHVNQTINGVNQEVPFQVEDWASEYRIPLGLTNNATVFSNKQMIVFLIDVNVSNVTIWWDGRDTAIQTPNAYTNIYFTGDAQGSNRLTNGKLTLQFGSSFTVTSTVGSVSSVTQFMRINNESSTYGAELAYVIHHGVVRDIVHQEAEWGTAMGGGGAYNCPNVYASIVLTLPAKATYYTYQLRLMFIDSVQPRTITSFYPLNLTTATIITQLQTENGNVNGIPIVANGSGSFSSSVWAHHWSQFISSNQGAGIMFTNASNQQLYIFDPMAGTNTGVLRADNSTRVIELRPVSLAPVSFNNALDVAWHGAVATFDSSATPVYTLQGTAPSGLWLLVEYPPRVTVTSET